MSAGIRPPMPTTTLTLTRLGMSILLTATTVGSIEIASGTAETMIAETMTDETLLVETLLVETMIDETMIDAIFVTITDAKVFVQRSRFRPLSPAN
jgi:hypothetical protein